MNGQERFRKTLRNVILAVGVGVGGCNVPAIPQSSQAGQLEEINCDNARGWVKRDSDTQLAPWGVILETDRLIFSDTKGDYPETPARREFDIVIPEQLKDGKPHKVYAYVAGQTRKELSGSPKIINCPPPEK